VRRGELFAPGQDKQSCYGDASALDLPALTVPYPGFGRKMPKELV
jgi:hypothetical protein